MDGRHPQPEREPAMQHLLDALPAHVAVLDRAGVIIATNAAWHRFAAANDARPDAVGVGANYLAVCQAAIGTDAALAAEVARHIQAVLAGASSHYSVEYACHSPTEQRWFQLTVMPLAGAAGGAVITHYNTTAYKRVEGALRATEANLRAIVNNSLLSFVLIDRQRRVRAFNTVADERVRRVFGRPLVEGAPIDHYLWPEDRASFDEHFAAALRGESMLIEHAFPAIGGKEHWFELNYVPVIDEDGQVTSVCLSSVDITGRKLAEAARARLLEREQAARLEAETALQVRDTFLSIAAHELRTPLTALKGYVQLLERRLDEPALDRDRLAVPIEQFRRQVDRFEALVANLLDVSRLRQGRLALRLEPGDVTALARQVLQRFEQGPERTERHRLVLEASGPVPATFDPARLDQVLTNLVSNALRYSPAGGEVRLRVARSGSQQVEVSVSDQGIGIAPTEQARLFQPFVRGEAVRDTISGQGLGLYIAAQIVEQHGGTIVFHSEPGVGSTFTIQLPLSPPSQPVAAPGLQADA